MFAPRPTNSDRSEVLFACFTGSSLASTPITTRTVYRPFTAVQVPRVTGAVATPTPIVPVNEPVSVRTVEPVSVSTVSVMPCVPPAEATVPWLRTATVNVTVAPPGGLSGDQPTDAATDAGRDGDRRAGREPTDGRGADLGGTEVEVHVGRTGRGGAGVADGRRQGHRVGLHRRGGGPGDAGDGQVGVGRRRADHLELGDLPVRR